MEDEPAPPQMTQKQKQNDSQDGGKARGFRARLNAHIDEGGQKTDAEIEELKKQKDED